MIGVQERTSIAITLDFNYICIHTQLYTKMPSLLVDRTDEVRELRRLAHSNKPELALLTGRRRVGKTYLLTHAWEEERLFLYTASRTTAAINRRQLLSDFAAWSGTEIQSEDHPTWRSMFNLLLDVAGQLREEYPVVLVLDEFQYLTDTSDGAADVASELNAAWERQKGVPPILLVLAGSAIGTMEALAGGGGPLYGRFSWHHKLRPFNYVYASEMTPFPDLRDRALAYGVFGGTPRYLASLNIQKSLASNIIRLMIRPGGEVRQSVETALDQEDGLRDVSKYRAIVHAIATGSTVRNEIAQQTGLGNDTGLIHKLNGLIDLGYIEIRRNIDARPREAVRYAVSDPAFRFHQKFVEPAASIIERYTPERAWETSIAARVDTYMGLTFEKMAGQAYDHLADRLGVPLVREWGRWEGTDQAGRSLEIDLLAELVDGRMLSGAVKWNREPVSGKLHWDHMDMLQRAAHAGRKWAYRALEPGAVVVYVAAGGFTPDFDAAVEGTEQQIVRFGLEEMYAV